MPLVRSALLLAGVCCSAACAQSPEAILKRVDAHYNHLSTLQTRYTERYTGMGMDRTESGTLELKKPGRMRWSYDSPAGKVFILDGKNGWFYTPGDAQAQRISAKQLDDLRSPLRLLLGHTQLAKELRNVQVKASGSGYQVSGVPIGMNQRVRLLTLLVHDDGAIETMRVEEVDGATTSFTFSGMRENVPLNDADFRFALPSGVTIVEGQPPV